MTITVDYTLAESVLKQAQSQIINEIARCGSAGGVGRAQNYAPLLVQVNQALDIVKKVSNSEKMEAVRSAKKD